MQIELLRADNLRSNKWGVNYEVLEILEYKGRAASPNGTVRIMTTSQPNMLRFSLDGVTWYMNVLNVDRLDNNIVIINYSCNMLQTLRFNGSHSLVCNFTNAVTNYFVNNGTPIQSNYNVYSEVGDRMPNPQICLRIKRDLNSNIPEYFDNCGFSVVTFTRSQFDYFQNVLGSKNRGNALSSVIDAAFYAPVNNIAGNNGSIRYPTPSDTGLSWTGDDLMCNYLSLSSGVWDFSLPIMSKTTYLDYEPYTKIECYIPSVGNFTINPSSNVSHIRVLVDYSSGTTLAFAMRGEEVITVLGGGSLQTVSLLSTNNSLLDYEMTSNNNALSSMSSALSLVGGIATENPMMAIGGLNGLVSGALKSDYISDITSNYSASKIGSAAGSAIAKNPYFRTTITTPITNYSVQSCSDKGIPVYIRNPTIESNKYYRFDMQASVVEIKHSAYKDVVQILERGVIG